MLSLKWGSHLWPRPAATTGKPQVPQAGSTITSIGVGSVIAGALVSLVAFPVKAKTGSVDPDILRHLALLYLPCIVLLNGAAIVALSFHRMDRATHEQNLARLREAAALAAQAESAEAAERPAQPGPVVGGAPTAVGKPA